MSELRSDGNFIEFPVQEYFIAASSRVYMKSFRAEETAFWLKFDRIFDFLEKVCTF